MKFINLFISIPTDNCPSEWFVLSLLSSVFLPHAGDLIVLLSQEVRKDEIFWLEK
jgi:hypothetical protein